MTNSPTCHAPLVAALVAALSTSCAPRAAAPTARTGSVQVVDVDHRAWTDDRGQTVTLADYRGAPAVVAMFYRSCRVRCPMTLGALRRVEEAFAKAHEPVRFVLVTLDPQSDTPERLAKFREEQRLDGTWHLLSGTLTSTRALARFLNLRAFTDDTHIDHDVRIGVFDRAGRFTRSFQGWDFDADDVIAATRPTSTSK